ncbi:Hypothetical predicted protein [Prunus dulcis]|uniref:Uncharacterized protein n=1 Tax=Prunus dulcis TaxID=3755 RepID=A0A5E4GDC1_PRUDU|nr:Hypothetical predicted protein [Prunus dulcis]
MRGGTCSIGPHLASLCTHVGPAVGSAAPSGRWPGWLLCWFSGACISNSIRGHSSADRFAYFAYSPSFGDSLFADLGHTRGFGIGSLPYGGTESALGGLVRLPSLHGIVEAIKVIVGVVESFVEGDFGRFCVANYYRVEELLHIRKGDLIFREQGDERMVGLLDLAESVPDATYLPFDHGPHGFYPAESDKNTPLLMDLLRGMVESDVADANLLLLEVFILVLNDPVLVLNGVASFRSSSTLVSRAFISYFSAFRCFMPLWLGVPGVEAPFSFRLNMLGAVGWAFHPCFSSRWPVFSVSTGGVPLAELQSCQLRLAYAERQQERRMGIGRMRTMGVKEEEKPMLGLEISVKPRAR